MTGMDEDDFYEPWGPEYALPPSEDCPHCPCHTARVCEGALWWQASPPTYPDGRPYTQPCPCRTPAVTPPQ